MAWIVPIAVALSTFWGGQQLPLHILTVSVTFPDPPPPPPDSNLCVCVAMTLADRQVPELLLCAPPLLTRTLRGSLL